ncbi:HlyD family secretion protein [Serratia surfactantfaciens]|uniref:HlyD family secretion protein n=1 Tax=Serratia surfactantfaciens TaxID=2741499 RepID=UPI003EE0B8DA
MSNGLFRRQVKTYQQKGWYGDVNIASPISHKVWAFSALLCFVLIISWLFIGKYTRRENVQGELVPLGGVIRLVARAPGDVSRIYVKEGGSVSKGQPIIALTGERFSVSEGGVVQATLVALHAERLIRLKDIDSFTQSAEGQINDVKKQISAVNEQIKQNEVELNIYINESQEQRELLKKVESLLSKGYISGVEYQQRRTIASNARATVTKQLSQRKALEQQLYELEGKLRQIPLTMKNQINDARREVSRIESEINRSELDKETIIRAAEAGTISSLLVSEGQSVTTGQSLGAMISEGEKLQAEFLVRSAAAGFIKAGATVVFHYPAYPYQKFGVNYGVVSSVSKSTLTQNDIAFLTGKVNAAESLYRVKVTMREQYISAYGEKIKLKAGMMVDANILLESRRVFEWIFEPIYAMRARAQEDI